MDENSHKKMIIWERILLMAVSHNRVFECSTVLEEARSNENLLSMKFLELLEKVFKPIASVKGENWTANLKTPPPLGNEGLQRLLLPEPKAGMSTIERKKSQLSLPSQCVEISPNVLCLFVEQSICPNPTITSPPVNHRPLRLQRVWCKRGHGIKKNHGMIGTLMGIGDQQSIYELDYVCWAYTIRNCGQPSGVKEAPVVVEAVFGHEKINMAEDQGYGTEIAHHTTTPDLKNMCNLLKVVRPTLFDCSRSLEICRPEYS